MKKTKKLSALILGGLLAIGVGAGMGASRVETGRAATGTFTIALNDNSLGAQTAYAEDKTTASYNGGDATVSLAWGNINPKTGQVRGNQTTQTNLQNAGKFNVRMRNTTALPGNIRSVTLSGISGTYVSASAFVATGSSEITNQTQGGSTAGTNGSSAITWSFTGESGKYFALGAIKGVFSGTVTATSIIVTYETEGAPVTLTSIAVTTPPTKTSYAVGEYLNLAGLVVTGTYSNSTTANVTGACTFSPTTSTPLTTAHTSVTVSHAGVSSTSFSITVSADPAISLNKSSLKVEIGDSDTIQVTPSNFSGDPVVTVKFASTNNATGTYASASVSGMVITVTGTADGNDTLNVTATLGGQTANSNAAITVEAPSIGDWEKVTSAANLTEGKYIITAPKTAGGELMAIDNTNGTGKPPAVNLTWSGTVPSKAVYDPVKSLGTNVIWDFTTSGSNYIIKPNNASTYLYSTNANDGLKVGSTSDTWIIDFVSSYFTMQETNYSRFIQIYNSADFRAYTSITSGGQISSNADCFKMQLFKWVSSAPLTTTLTITGTLTNGSQYAGSFLDVAGLTFTANYVGGGTGVILTSQLNALPKLVLGTTSYQVSYTEGDITATGTVTLTAVLADTLNTLSWTGRVLIYTEGQTLTESSIVAKYASGNEVPLGFADVTIYVFEDTWNPATATIITAATVLTDFDHNGLSIRLGLDGVYSTTSVLTVTFAPTTTYIEGGGGVSTTATLIKSPDTLVVGDKVLIAAAGYDFVMSTTQNGNNRASEAAIKSGDKITNVDESKMQVVTIVAGTVTNSFGFYVEGDSTGYLYAASSSQNYLRTQTNLDANASFIVTIAADGAATATAQGANTRNLFRFNNTNDPKLFSCYGSGQEDLAFYTLDPGAGSSGVNYEYLLDVLAGDYCDFTLEGLNKIHTRYTAMTSSEIAHFNIETIVGDDTNEYTGLEAYTYAMILRARLQNDPSNVSDNFGSDAAISEEVSIAFIVVVAALGVTAIGAFFFIRRKETNES